MRVLAINPWIEDFAAYDYWLKPYGFLKILTHLKNHGADITYIDCLDRLQYGGRESNQYGCGKFLSQKIAKPDILKDVPRTWKRYGMPEESFTALLKKAPKPDYILFTSSMTYWYPGVQHAVKKTAEVFPDVPRVLGGVYATLCYAHAKKNIECQHVFKAPDIAKFFKLLRIPYDQKDFRALLPDYPAFYPKMEYVVVKTGEGCVFNCAYCAANRIAPDFYKVDIAAVVDFLYFYYARGIRNFTFFDDCLFYPAEHIKKLLEAILKKGIRGNFHTPNGVHVRYIDQELATLMKKVNFIDPFLSVETLDFELQKKLSPKITADDIQRAVSYLHNAGYKNGELWCYLLFCLPEQDIRAVYKDALILHGMGLSVYLTEYSPIPGSDMIRRYRIKIPDPLLTNNSIYFLAHENYEEIFGVKTRIRELNKKF